MKPKKEQRNPPPQTGTLTERRPRHVKPARLSPNTGARRCGGARGRLVKTGRSASTDPATTRRFLEALERLRSEGEERHVAREGLSESYGYHAAGTAHPERRSPRERMRDLRQTVPPDGTSSSSRTTTRSTDKSTPPPSRFRGSRIGLCCRPVLLRLRVPPILPPLLLRLRIGLPLDWPDFSPMAPIYKPKPVQLKP